MLYRTSGHAIAFIALYIGAATALLADEPSVEFQVLQGPNFRSSKPIYMAINSSEEWSAFRKMNHESSVGPNSSAKTEAVPAIDFKNHTLLVACSGNKPNSGYSIAFTSVREINGQVSVSVLEIAPGVNCPTSQEITNPRALALISKSSKNVTFEVRRAVIDCKANGER